MVNHSHMSACKLYTQVMMAIFSCASSEYFHCLCACSFPVSLPDEGAPGTHGHSRVLCLWSQ